MRLKTLVVGGLFAGLLAGPAPATAQIGVGPIGGVSFANFHGADSDILGESPSSRTGFLVGAMLDIPLGAVSIRPEAFYVQKGANAKESGVGEAGLNMDYIEIPVLVVVGINTGGSVKPEFFAGPQVSFQVKCEFTASLEGFPEIPSQDCESDEVSTTDYGIIVGGGVAVGGFIAQVVFDYSLKTLDAEDDPFDIKNKAFYVLVGWMFRLN